MPGNSNIGRLADNTIYYPQSQSPPRTSPDSSSPLLPSRHFTNLPKPAGDVDLASPSPPPPEFIPAIKRSESYVDLTDEFDNEEPATKRVMREVPGFTEAPAPVVLTAEERYELDQLERRPKPKPIHDETKIELSPEQEEVVNLAMQKSNIFLTGAAGCGKTVTLKEILARLKKKTTGGNVQVVAPTGIAALPLEGKTTYSFAGVSGNLLKGAGRRSNLSGSGIQTLCGKALMNYLRSRRLASSKLLMIWMSLLSKSVPSDFLA
jgi:PIF1-like helicase